MRVDIAVEYFRDNTIYHHPTSVCIFLQTQCTKQARSQDFAMGGCFEGLGAKPPAAGDWGFGGEAPSRRRHGGLGAEPPTLENFAFFSKSNFILGHF